MDFFVKYGPLLLEATGQTLLMVVVSTLLSYLVGVPLGLLTFISAPGSVAPRPRLYAVLDWIINIVRSIPFIVLLVAIIPLTQMLAGTYIGAKGAIVPLTLASIPFVGRMVQSSISELDKGVIESTRAMGATNLQIVTRVLLPEALPSLVRGMSITTITLVGYTAMAGFAGAGGLGDVAIRFGFHRYQPDVMFACIVILVLLVQLIQLFFDRAAARLDKNKS